MEAQICDYVNVLPGILGFGVFLSPSDSCFPFKCFCFFYYFIHSYLKAHRFFFFISVTNSPNQIRAQRRFDELRHVWCCCCRGIHPTLLVTATLSSCLFQQQLKIAPSLLRNRKRKSKFNEYVLTLALFRTEPGFSASLVSGFLN